MFAGPGVAGATGRHDLLDRGLGALTGRDRHLDRVTGFQKPLAIVVVGAMLCTLFLTRYMMPILYSYFPAPLGVGGGAESGHLVEGTNYSRMFMHDFPEEEGAIPNSRALDNGAHGDGRHGH